LSWPSPIIFDGDAVALGDALHGFGEREMIIIHEKMENAAAGLTSEAVIDAFFLTDREGRGFLGMKWAQAQMIATGLLERNEIGDDLDDGGTLADLDDFILTNHCRELQSSRVRRRDAFDLLAVKNLLLAEMNKILAKPRERPGEIRVLDVVSRRFGQKR
jgi:hypothetical protein